MEEQRDSENLPRILAVEDEPAIRRFYERFCESQGYELVLAPTGNAALEILRSGREFDVILLDVRLPGVSGRALWKWMAIQRPELCRRVIIVTGDILGESTRQLIDDVGRPFLEKPFSIPELVETITAVLTGHDNEDPKQGRCVGE
jgi:DNA-binding response OmpR family regulator